MSSRRAECVFSGLPKDMPVDVMRVIVEYTKLDDRGRVAHILAKHSAHDGGGSIYFPVSYCSCIISWDNANGHEYEKKYYHVTIRFSRISAVHSVLTFDELPDKMNHPESRIDIESYFRGQMAEIE